GRGGNAEIARDGGKRRRHRESSGCGHGRARGAGAGLRRGSRRADTGARLAAPPPQIFHRRARSLRLDRVFPRLSVGLRVLQRLDILRPLLPLAPPRVRGRGAGGEPRVFIVDDVSFIHEEHGMAIGEGIARRGIQKKYYLETRGDVLLRNKDVFKFWRGIGLKYIFLGLEAIDAEGLQKFRKRTSLGENFEALE